MNDYILHRYFSPLKAVFFYRKNKCFDELQALNEITVIKDGRMGKVICGVSLAPKNDLSSLRSMKITEINKNTKLI